MCIDCRSCVVGPGKHIESSLLDCPFSAEVILPPKDQAKYEKVINRLDDSFFAARALIKSVDRVISFRKPWAWLSNSCHLDSWLMVELSFFDYLVRKPGVEEGMVTDDMVVKSPALKKLFKVLLAAGLEAAEEQESLKMGYWGMEIEEYLGGTQQARRNFGAFSDYSKHGELFADALRRENNLDLRQTHIGLQPECNNPEHINIQAIYRKRTEIRAADYWFSLPDDWVRKKDSDGRWHFPESNRTPHAGIGDVMGTEMGRSEGETTECQKCATDLRKSHQITWKKVPAMSKLPLALEINIDPDQVVRPEESFTIGGTEYKLLSIVFADGKHFKCNIVLAGKWYHYDDLGMRSRVCPGAHQTPQLPRVPRLVRCHEYLAPPPPARRFNPIVFRYAKVNATALQPDVIRDPGGIPTDLHFSSMWRLLS